MVENQQRRRSRDLCVHGVVFVLLWFVRELFLVVALAFLFLLCSLSWGLSNRDGKIQGDWEVN